MDTKAKDRVAKYLISNHCNPSLKGFNILVELILISVKEPDFNKQQLFGRFLENHGNTLNERAVYRSAKYCLDTSLCSEKRVFPMVKTTAIYLRDEL